MLSILDTDLYKLTTSNAYWMLYPLSEGTFKFTDRNKEKYDEDFIKQLIWEFDKFRNLKLTDQEFNWCINSIPYVPRPYFEWLKTFRFEPEKIKVSLDSDNHLQIEVTDLLYKVTWYEIPILATVSELRNKFLGYSDSQYDFDRLKRKLDIAIDENLKFSEFGTRRRFSAETHKKVYEELIKLERVGIFVGSSNMYFSMLGETTPIGTYPHEFIQMHAALFGNKRANYLTLEDWIKVYRGDLGTALTDLFGTKSFLRTLTKQQALLLKGFRIDSGNEYEIGNLIIDRLEEFGIDPRTKQLIFSNGLDFLKYRKINDYFKGRVQVSAGIGTNLTCDPGIKDYKPANIVMKLSKCRMSEKDPWEKCIKISDDLGKHMGDEKEIEIALYELHLK